MWCRAGDCAAAAKPIRETIELQPAGRAPRAVRCGHRKGSTGREGGRDPAEDCTMSLLLDAGALLAVERANREIIALIKQELLDSAEICEEVANDIEDRLPGG